MTDQEYEKIKRKLKTMSNVEKIKFWDKAGATAKLEYKIIDDDRFNNKINKIEKITFIVLGSMIVLGMLIALVFGSSGSGGSGSRTCGSCGRSFSDSANVSSIKRTNMCSNCYHNYQVAVNTKDKVGY